jgi:alginate O-acetyltransferase complex protein AlgJ
MIVIAILLILTLPLGSMVMLKVFAGGSAVELGIPSLALAGIFPQVTRPDFTLQDWLSHRFQDNASKWFNRYFGARALFVRLGNQVNYSLFGTSYMNNQNNQTIIIGKQSQLYEVGYINDYCKLVHPMPLELAEAHVKEIAEIQDQLARRGIAFILLISPSKAAIYPEFFPDIFCSSHKSTNRDYENFIPLLDRYKINYVDGHTITFAAKAREQAPVFSQGGTHWNDLGAYYAAERLLKMIETLTSQSIGRLSLQHLEIDHTPTGRDKDLAEILNLMFPPYNYLVPRPTIVREGPAYHLGKAVWVGGSFIWAILDILNGTNIFQTMDAYYYYKLLLKSYPAKTSRQIDVSQIDWDKDILTSQVLVLETNETNFSPKYLTAFLSDILRYLRANPHD